MPYNPATSSTLSSSSGDNKLCRTIQRRRVRFLRLHNITNPSLNPFTLTTRIGRVYQIQCRTEAWPRRKRFVFSGFFRGTLLPITKKTQISEKGHFYIFGNFLFLNIGIIFILGSSAFLGSSSFLGFVFISESICIFREAILVGCLPF